MKKVTIILVIIAVAAGLFFELRPKSEDVNTGQTSNTSDIKTDSKAAVQTTKVTISDFAFGPAKISVKKGSTVTWTNQDSVQHNVNSDTQSSNFEGSELLSKGESYSYTFNTVGTYTYHCTPHPSMQGSVEVTE